MFSKEDVLKLRHNEEFFVDKFSSMISKMSAENPDFVEEECVYGAAVMLSYVIHDTSQLTMEELTHSVEQIIDRFVQYGK
jgi:hypothetical protein